jgi:hypothetical protein
MQKEWWVWLMMWCSGRVLVRMHKDLGERGIAMVFIREAGRGEWGVII